MDDYDTLSPTANPIGLDFNKLDHFDLEVIICNTLREYCSALGFAAKRENNELLFGEYNLILRPTIAQLNKQSVLLRFEMLSDNWDKSIIENSAGMGADTARALSNALESFTSACLEGLLAMISQKNSYETCTSSFLGHEHQWKVYLGDLVSVGEAPDIKEAQYYWEELKELILARLGNQRFCYIKVSASKSFGSVFCECRIDNIISHDMTKHLMEQTQNWPTEKFASHKMFFFLQQQPDTILPGPLFYAPEQRELSYQVNVALRLFSKCSCDEDYAELINLLKEVVPDPILAQELYYFLPEMCVRRLFNEISFSDQLTINISSQANLELTAHQLSDYMPIERALDEVLAGSQDQELLDGFKICAYYSSTYSLISHMLEDSPKAKITDLTELHSTFFTTDNFIIR